MARSARPTSAISLLVAAALLSGCVTTQRRNERAKLAAQRELAGREALRVQGTNPLVWVTAATLVRGRPRSAVVVDLASRAERPLTDVPVEVGVRTRGGRSFALNTRGGHGWFGTHLAAIASRGRATFVVETRRRLPAGVRAYARAGSPAGPVRSSAARLPGLQARALAPAARRVPAVVENHSDIPQSEVPVYAVARAAGRPVAAGRLLVERLPGDARERVWLSLIGRPGGAPLRVDALPTIFE